MSTQNPWRASQQSTRPRWHREWPLLLFFPAGLAFAFILWRPSNALSFGEVLALVFGILGALVLGMGGFRLMIAARFARARELHPDGIVFEVIRATATDAMLRGMSETGLRPAYWSVVAVDASGLYCYLRDPSDTECVFIPASHIVGVEMGETSVRDGYGSRTVPAIMVHLNATAPVALPLAPRSERWNATFRYAASYADRDLLLGMIRETLPARSGDRNTTGQ
ncbi:hypothetical protein GCM10027406_28580 [Leifsonia lichenia]